MVNMSFIYNKREIKIENDETYILFKVLLMAVVNFLQI